jgi:hypothetical protein
MENKKSFVLYCDLIHTVNKLPDEQAGKLLKIILEYVNDLNPQVDDLLLSVSFEPIRQQLKRDLEKWTENAADRSEKARKAGIASGIARQLKATKTNSLVQNELKPTKRTVNVSVNDNVNDSNILARKLAFKESLFKYVGKYKKQTVKAFFEYWSEHGDNDKKMRFEKEKSFGVGRRLSTWAKNDFDKTENPEEEKGKGSGGFSMMEAYEQNKPQ